MKANQKTFFLFRLGIVVLILALSCGIITDPLAIKPENPRLLKQEEKLLRGRILIIGRVISFTENKEEFIKGSRAIAPLVGYTSSKGRAD